MGDTFSNVTWDNITQIVNGPNGSTLTPKQIEDNIGELLNRSKKGPMLSHKYTPGDKPEYEATWAGGLKYKIAPKGPKEVPSTTRYVELDSGGNQLVLTKRLDYKGDSMATLDLLTCKKTPSGEECEDSLQIIKADKNGKYHLLSKTVTPNNKNDIPI